MPGIFPNISAGGVTVRDIDGVCLNPSGVANGYCPPEEFQTSCAITMLPEDCTARILPSQINAIVSELLCFAEALTPEGPWNCNDVCNLSQAFASWWIANVPHGDGVTITENAPYSVLPQGVVSAICANEPAFTALLSCLISGDANNLITVGGVDTGLYATVNTDGDIIIGNGTPGSPITIDIAELIVGICGTNAFKSALATCLISATANNAITLSANGLFVNSANFVPVARTVNTQFSLTGGGNLGANRTLNLVNDVAAPGNLRYYGTDAGGTRGWFPLTGLQMYQSPPQTITNGATVFMAHGLGVEPKFYEILFRCVVATAGWAVGETYVQRVSYSPSSGGHQSGVALYANATDIALIFGASGVLQVNKGTGAVNQATSANWNVIVRAFA